MCEGGFKSRPLSEAQRKLINAWRFVCTECGNETKEISISKGCVKCGGRCELRNPLLEGSETP